MTLDGVIVQTLWPWSSNSGDALRGQDLVYTEMNLGIRIMWTWIMWLSKVGHALRAHNLAYIEDMIRVVWRCTSRSKSCECWDALGGQYCVNIKLHIKAMIDQIGSCIWRLYNNKMYLGHREHLGESEHCRTRIPWWSNPRVYWNDAVTIRCTWEPLRVQATSLGAPTTHLAAPTTHLEAPNTSLGVPTTSLGAPTTSLGAHRIAAKQSRNNIIFFWNTAGAPGNHGYYLSFNDF